MKFAICNELFESWPHEKAIDFIAATGYTGIEVAPFTLGESPSDVSASQRAAFRSRVESAGLEVIGLHWLLARTDGFHLTSRDADLRSRTLKRLIELTNLTADLGGNVMVFGSPQQRNFVSPVTQDEALRYTINLLEELVPTLDSQNVTLAIEPLGPEETNFIQTAAQAQQICDAIGSPKIQLHLDVKAMSTEQDSVAAIIRQNSGKFVHFHANDPNRQGPGSGEVDFVPIFEELNRSRYQGWVSVEVFDFSAGPKSIATESLDYMRRVELQIQNA